MSVKIKHIWKDYCQPTCLISLIFILFCHLFQHVSPRAGGADGRQPSRSGSGRKCVTSLRLVSSFNPWSRSTKRPAADGLRSKLICHQDVIPATVTLRHSSIHIEMTDARRAGLCCGFDSACDALLADEVASDRWSKQDRTFSLI